MRDFRILAFDEIIIGTATTWYTSSDLDPVLGLADGLAMHAITTNVSGTSPALVCQFQHSGNAKDWLSVNGTPEINGTPNLSNDLSLSGVVPALNPTLLSNVRIKIWLNGTTPQCRLKLFVTGRVSRIGQGASPAQGLPQMPGRGI